jgi:peptidoglycan/LPS O-acetylase OafA/YrhL
MTNHSVGTVAPPAQPSPGAAGRVSGGRLTWLDATRGFAAVAVVWWHLASRGIINLQSAHDWVDIGKYGVVLFFLISGYVIPMSLERHGNLRHFWISRLFRLYPAWAVSALFIIGLYVAGVFPVPAGLTRAPLTVTIGHLTMLQGLLGVPNLVPIYWTLSYEMVFYLVVAGLFAIGLHRHSALWACLLAGTALLLGPRLHQDLLTGGGERRLLIVTVALIALALVVAGAITGRRRIAIPAAAFGLVALLIPLFNGGESVRTSWQSLILLAAMFAGTIVHRIQHGQLRPLIGGLALAFVLACGLVGAWVHVDDPIDRRVWSSTLILAAATLGIMFLFRNKRMPRFAIWLGEISYSVYLLHLLLLMLFIKLVPGLPTRHVLLQLAGLIGYFIVLFAVATLVYRYVELPAQRLGRQLSKRLDRSGKPDPRPSEPPPPSVDPGAVVVLPLAPAAGLQNAAPEHGETEPTPGLASR